MGKRELLETWAEVNEVDIILLQETKINQSGIEKRKDYTIFFSGDNTEEEHTEAGVAIMIKNSLLNTVIDVIPIDDRIMTITIRIMIIRMTITV